MKNEKLWNRFRLHLRLRPIDRSVLARLEFELFSSLSKLYVNNKIVKGK